VTTPAGFVRLAGMDPQRQVRLTVDGRGVVAQRGETLLAALLAAGLLQLRRSDRRGAPRGAFCGMGVCMDCLVWLQGRGLVRSCAVTVEPDMVCSTQPPAQGGS